MGPSSMNNNSPMPVAQPNPPTSNHVIRSAGPLLLKCVWRVEMKLKEITWKDVQNYSVNDGPKLVFIILWLIVTLGLFAERFHHYYAIQPAAYELIGYGVPVARGSAASIKFNCALLLLCVLRNFLSYIRGTWLGSYLPVDKNIIFHKNIAWTIAVFAALHGFAHYQNYNKISQLPPLDLLRLRMEPPTPTVNQLAFTTLAGWTGHAVSIIMVIMFTAATLRVRSPMFEVFWFSHHLFIPFIVLLCFHGFDGRLEPPTFWAWILGPAFLYLIERSLRIKRGKKETMLQKAVQHPSRVMELQMKKADFVYKSGQYLFLQCSFIGAHEWHPFTITSCPDEDFVSVHIRIVGDWTGALSSFLNPDKKQGVVQENLATSPDGTPILKIDGPFGAAAEEAFHFQTVMLIGAGIGVTPYASILKSIKYRIEKGDQTVRLKKVYFYWISPDRNAFEWFADLLKELERENVNNILEINIYLTGTLSSEEIKTIMYGDAEADEVTGLASRTNFGRPNWKEIFQDKAQHHNNEDVGVFFCGPRVISKTLYNACRRYTFETSTRFHYKKENF